MSNQTASAGIASAMLDDFDESYTKDLMFRNIWLGQDLPQDAEWYAYRIVIDNIPLMNLYGVRIIEFKWKLQHFPMLESQLELLSKDWTIRTSQVAGHGCN